MLPKAGLSMLPAAPFSQHCLQATSSGVKISNCTTFICQPRFIPHCADQNAVILVSQDETVPLCRKKNPNHHIFNGQQKKV